MFFGPATFEKHEFCSEIQAHTHFTQISLPFMSINVNGKGGWTYRQSEYPPLKKVLEANIWTQLQYQPSRDRFRKPVVEPVLSVAAGGIHTIDIHIQVGIQLN